MSEGPGPVKVRSWLVLAVLLLLLAPATATGLVVIGHDGGIAETKNPTVVVGPSETRPVCPSNGSPLLGGWSCSPGSAQGAIGLDYVSEGGVYVLGDEDGNNSTIFELDPANLSPVQSFHVPCHLAVQAHPGAGSLVLFDCYEINRTWVGPTRLFVLNVESQTLAAISVPTVCGYCVRSMSYDSGSGRVYVETVEWPTYTRAPSPPSRLVTVDLASGSTLANVSLPGDPIFDTFDPHAGASLYIGTFNASSGTQATRVLALDPETGAVRSYVSVPGPDS